VTRKKYNTKKIRTFLLFLGVACVIWVLTKFSKEYTATINGDIVYSNLPENIVLGEGNAQDISFEVTAVGFKFLQYQLNKPRIEIPLNNFAIDETNKVVLESMDLNRLVSSELGKDVSISNLSLSKINISLDRVGSRKVPVIANTDITYREGFKTINGPVLSPDSVNIFAPNEILYGIDSILTTLVSLNDLYESVEVNVKLELPDKENFNVEPKQVELQLDVTEFTQKTVSVPIEVINVPSGTTLKIIPEVLTISFDVAMERFNDISDSDFTVVCDFTQRNNEENFMLVELSKQPEGIFHIEFSEKKIDYLIFK
jgi:hypothetical protein